MNFTPEIFKAFQNKLKVGNRRGIHLNAIPGNSRYKFDLARMAHIYKSLPERFILDLLTLRSLNFKFSIHEKEDSDDSAVEINENRGFFSFESDEYNSKKEAEDATKKELERTLQLNKLVTSFENIIFQNEVIQSEKGLNSLGFGFPLLIRRDMHDGQISVSPILIWSVKIKATHEMNTWEITRSEDDPIYLNEVLINHLQTDSGVFLNPIPDEMLEDGKIDKPELKAICSAILNQLKVEQDLDFLLNNYERILPIKSKASYEKLVPEKGNAIIEKCGLFSLFEVQKQNIINDYSDLIENFKPHENPINTRTFQSITAIETDPSQQGILESLKTQTRIVIQGPPGTGKSQTLTALLVNALENKQKTIVVCEKQTALEVLQNALQIQQLDAFCVMIKDSVSDRKNVVDAVRNVVDNSQFKEAKEVYPGSVLQEHLDGIHVSKNEINSIHHKLNEPLINQQTWSEIVGLWLQSLELKEEVNIETLPFAFDTEEWKKLLDLIETGQPKYEKYKPFSENVFYNPEKITETDPFSSQNNTVIAFKQYELEWQEIMAFIKDFEVFYDSKRKEIFAKQLEDLQKIRQEILIITATLNENNDEFNLKKTQGILYQMGSWFSASKKTVLKNQKRLQELLILLKTITLDSNFVPIELSPDLWQNIKASKNYESNIEQAKETFLSKIETDFEQIDFFNFYESSFQNSDLDKIQKAAKILKNKIQSDCWLHQWHAGTTFSSFREAFLTALNTHQTLASNPDNPFLQIYNWHQFYQGLTGFHKQFVEKFYAVTHWKDSFVCAYLNLLLHKNTHQNLNFNEDHYLSLQKKITHFSGSQYDFISSYWKNQQWLAAKLFEKTNPDITVANLYNKRKSTKFNRLTLRQIVANDMDLFTSFFPIVFTTPDVCCNLFQGKNFYFDNVVFDEASQLKLEDNLPALLKGKNIIIAGDEHQMPPSNYFSKVFDGGIEDEDDLDEETVISQKNALLNVESLLDFALEFKFEKNHLDFHYRSKHPFLIDFSNHAFYDSRLKPLPALNAPKPITFYEVGGVFHEHINQEEAEKVLEILEQIQPNSDGTFPSVGIATFNITQRNYIKRQIAYKQSLPENSDFRTKIVALEAAGLFIKNLENIQGDERDIIIISTTYGRKKDGRFIQSFGPINHSKGYKLLNVIITRAKSQIYICNSVPTEMFENYKEVLKQEGSNNRRAVFYAYLAYCKAVSDENETRRQEILHDLDQFSQTQIVPNQTSKDRFKEQVFKQLKNNIEAISIEMNHPFGGYQLDLFIKPKSGKPIAIECLSKDLYQGKLAYLEDIHKEKILRKAGFEYHRIWSQHWWQNKDRELAKWKMKLE
uniref:AAA domain-containing protein n=1 Tax=Flavobacterium sp. TaxID=239 RepID=UPI00404982A2